MGTFIYCVSEVQATHYESPDHRTSDNSMWHQGWCQGFAVQKDQLLTGLHQLPRAAQSLLTSLSLDFLIWKTGDLRKVRITGKMVLVTKTMTFFIYVFSVSLEIFICSIKSSET